MKALLIMIILFFALVAGLYSAVMWLSDIPFNSWFDFGFIEIMNDVTHGRLFIKNGLFAIGSLAAFVLITTFLFWEPKSRNRFGDARFATNNELRKYGYFTNKGLILGQTRFLGRLIMSYGPKTIGLSAPPRSGKTVSMVIPNLLNWEGSMIAVDVKKELFQITSGQRAAMGDKIIVFDPLSPDKQSHCINVFDDVSRDPDFTISDIDKLVENFIPADDKFWDAGAQNIFKAIALYLIETNQHISLGSIYRFANDGTNLQDKFLAIIDQEENLSEECLAKLSSYGNEESEKISGGFYAGFNLAMQDYANPLLAAATDKSDFDFTKLRTENTSIYLVVRPEHLQILGAVFGTVIETLAFVLTRHEPEKDEKGKVLFMCDEFTALGNLKRVKQGAAFFGGYGVRLVMIYQNDAQLKSIYNQHGSDELIGLMHERVVFAPSSNEEATKISRELGDMTIKTTNRSYSQGRVSRSVSESPKALMSARKLLEMPNKNELILATEQKPIKCKKIFYYKDKRFKSRLLPSYAQKVPRLIVKKYKFKEIEITKDDLTQSGNLADMVSEF
ncbi:MAG: type IV secretory system conjugative DNA transfer family protein [Flavobacteriaceae bacterium]